MKQKLFALLALCTSLLSFQDGGKYRIEGTCRDKSLNGRWVYLRQNDPYVKLDSAKIENERFFFEGDVSKQMKIASLMLQHKKTDKRIFYSTFLFLEEGVMKVQVDGDRSARGTKLNDEHYAYRKRVDSLDDIISGIYANLREEIKEGKIKEEEIWSLGEKRAGRLTSERKEILLSAFKRHSNDALGKLVIIERFELGVSPITANNYAAWAGENLLNAPEKVIKDFFKIGKQLKKKKITEFKDFSGVKPNGKPVKLSDYLGKGNYILLDFWASTCGPCRKEFDYLKKIQKEFADKNLTILGVAIWDRMESQLKAIKDDGITWEQIISRKEAAETYGIRAIPFIMLLSPDGQIVASDIREEEIEKALLDVLE